MKRLSIFSILLAGASLVACSFGTSSSSSSSSSEPSSSSSSSSSSESSSSESSSETSSESSSESSESSISSSSESVSSSSESISSSTSESSSVHHAHSYSSEYAYDADYHWYPTICGHDNEEGALNKEAHSYGEWTIATAPGCESEGVERRMCYICSYSETRSVDPTGHTFSSSWSYDSSGHYHEATCGHNIYNDYAYHTFGEWVVDKEATEESVGHQYRVCSVCDYSEQSEIPLLPHTHKYSSSYSADDDYHWFATTCGHDAEEGALNKVAHSYGEITVITEPDCDSTGLGTKTCSVCDHTMNVTLEEKGHSYSSIYSYDSSSHWRECTSCDGVTDVSSHTFGEWVITTEPQCEVAGIETRTCSVCSYSESQSVEPTGHTYSSSWNSNEYGHWHVATCGHNVQTGFEEHTFGEWTRTLEPTCEEAGVDTRICSVCSYAENRSVDATGHTYSSSYSYDENNHWHPSSCGHDVKSEVEAHTFGNVITMTAPTCTEAGSGYRECSICGYRHNEVIEATGHSYSDTYSYNGYE